MKITLSYSGGTLAGLHLANQFEKRGYSSILFQPNYLQKYPSLTKLFRRIENKQAAQTVNINNVRTNLKLILYKKILKKTIQLRSASICNDRFRIGDMVDQWVARNIASENADILIAESHQALHTIRKAKDLGMVTFLYRTNSHIKVQEKIDDEETKRLGLKSWHDYKDTERGLREYEEADYIIVLSTFAKKGFIDEGINSDKLLCIPLGIDVSCFWKIPKDDKVFRVVYCGGISHRKGIIYLLEAVSSLKLKNVELWLIGNIAMGMEKVLRKYDGCYKHIGFVPNHELYKYYSQGSVLVLPSLEDSFGRAIVEAMACGLPAIVSKNTAADDVIRENIDGFVVPIKDVDALKEKILFLYENQDICREMGENAMRRVHEKFNLDAFTDRMIAAFKSGLNSKRNR